MRPLAILSALQAGESGRTAAQSILRAIWLFSALLALGLMVDYLAHHSTIIVAKSRDFGFNPPVLRCEGNGAFTPRAAEISNKKRQELACANPCLLGLLQLLWRRNFRSTLAAAQASVDLVLICHVIILHPHAQNCQAPFVPLF